MKRGQNPTKVCSQKQSFWESFGRYVIACLLVHRKRVKDRELIRNSDMEEKIFYE